MPTAYLVFDRSGSINKHQEKKYQEIYNFYKMNYNIVIIGFTTKAIIYDTMDELLANPNNGGSYLSSGLQAALARLCLNNNDKDIVVIASDGDVWSEDITKSENVIKYIAEHNKIYIHYLKSPISSNHSRVFEKLNNGMRNIEKYIVDNNSKDIFGLNLVCHFYLDIDTNNNTIKLYHNLKDVNLEYNYSKGQVNKREFIEAMEKMSEQIFDAIYYGKDNTLSED